MPNSLIPGSSSLALDPEPPAPPPPPPADSGEMEFAQVAYLVVCSAGLQSLLQAAAAAHRLLIESPLAVVEAPHHICELRSCAASNKQKITCHGASRQDLWREYLGSKENRRTEPSTDLAHWLDRVRSCIVPSDLFSARDTIREFSVKIIPNKSNPLVGPSSSAVPARDAGYYRGLRKWNRVLGHYL